MFVEALDSIILPSGDLLVSLDVVSLFTRVPLETMLSLLEPLFPTEVVDLFRFVISSAYFVVGGKYEQVEWVAMGSPLSPIIVDFYMEAFEASPLQVVTLAPLFYRRYVDDTFLVWSHGYPCLVEFVDFLNSRHKNTKFTVDIEKERCLLFLDS